jgi:hypothetical protein
MIVIVMVFESVFTTARAVAAAAGAVYHTLLQYEAIIDRTAHAAYLLAVAVGAPPAVPDPFDETSSTPTMSSQVYLTFT